MEDRPDQGEEGFFIKSRGLDIVIGGSAQQGMVYGVYTFLEEVLGCRWYAPDCEWVPKSPTIEIGALDISQQPEFEYREPWYMIAWDVDWAVKNKVNGIGPALDKAAAITKTWQKRADQAARQAKSILDQQSE